MYLTAFFVFLARLVDVSLNTLKLKAVMRGSKISAFFIAFFEVLIYMLAASYAFKYIDNKLVLLLFCLGYAAGNYVGMIIDEKMAKGEVFVLMIGNHDEELIALADLLREKGFGVTTDKGWGLHGNPKLQLKVIVSRKRLAELQEIVSSFDCNNSIFMTVFDVKEAKSISATPRV